MVYPFLAMFARGLGVDLTSMSLALTARSLVGTIGPFTASVADSRGCKFGMSLGLGMFTFGTALVVFWPTFLGLAAAICLSTLGKYIFDPALQAYLSDRIKYEQRGQAIAVTEFGWSLAFVLGVPLMGFLIARLGWLAPFPLLALLGALIFMGILLMLPRDEKPRGDGKSLWVNFRLVLINAPALAGLAVGLFASTANEVVNLIFGVWLEDSFGLKIAALGAASAIIGLSELCGESLVAAFVDKLGKPRAVAIGLVGNSLAAMVLPIVGHSIPGALTGLFFFYISFEFTMVSSIPLMTELVPAARATFMSFNVAAFSLGRALGDLIAPRLYLADFWVVVAGALVFNLLALTALRYIPKHVVDNMTAEGERDT